MLTILRTARANNSITSFASMFIFTCHSKKKIKIILNYFYKRLNEDLQISQVVASERCYFSLSGLDDRFSDRLNIFFIFLINYNI